MHPRVVGDKVAAAILVAVAAASCPAGLARRPPRSRIHVQIRGKIGPLAARMAAATNNSGRTDWLGRRRFDLKHFPLLT